MSQLSPQEAEEKVLIMERLRSLSTFLDNSITIPGTSYRIGLDPFLGLLPGVGDYAGAAISAFIVIQGARLGASKSTLTRMVTNIIIESFAGTIPVFGDIFDAGWKANLKNVALLDNHIASSPQRKKADTWFVFLLLAVLALVVILTTTIFILLLSFLWQLIQ
ncbi:MAG: DUF4112 domain-containing protein [Spirulinaceae cyanobacterium]